MNADEEIVMIKSDDSEMNLAIKKAQATFKYYWREMLWEARRGEPELQINCVKVAFSDTEIVEDDSNVEHMWLTNINFDGWKITGTLINEPSHLTSISVGERVTAPLKHLSDWVIGFNGKAYGGFTVNVMRSKMSATEKKEHDRAWGIDFGATDQIDLVIVPPIRTRKFWGLLGTKETFDPQDVENALIEHPSSILRADSLIKMLKESPQLVHEKNEDGWTMLHEDALAGNASIVKVLLDHGANPNLKNNAGETPLDLAKINQWEKVIELLSN